MRVNGEPGELNTFVGAGDRVEVDGARSASSASPTCSCTSPRTVTTARDPRAARPSSRSSRAEPRVVPVGRLDADTTGAILLTNDGALAHRLAHPRYEVDKVYEAEVEGDPGRETLRRLERGHRARRRPHRSGAAPAASRRAASS